MVFLKTATKTIKQKFEKKEAKIILNKLRSATMALLTLHTVPIHFMAILEQENLTVIRKGGELPLVPFADIKNTLLGKKYNLTIIFCSPKESQDRNRTYRDKDYPTNILSFPLDEKEGEIKGEKSLRVIENAIKYLNDRSPSIKMLLEYVALSI
jgi:hypothetical protein